jgi:hypothetical protein
MAAAATIIPANPRIPATIATTRKIKAHRNIRPPNGRFSAPYWKRTGFHFHTLCTFEQPSVGSFWFNRGVARLARWRVRTKSADASADYSFAFVVWRRLGAITGFPDGEPVEAWGSSERSCSSPSDCISSALCVDIIRGNLRASATRLQARSTSQRNWRAHKIQTN